MSLIRAALSVLSTKKSLEYFIESFEYNYKRFKDSFPDQDPHQYLSMAWRAFIQAKGENPDDPSIIDAAFTTTYLVACVPEAQCARALGLFMAYRERPKDFARYPKLEVELNELIEPVMTVEAEGKLDELYRSRNPRMGR